MLLPLLMPLPPPPPLLMLPLLMLLRLSCSTRELFLRTKIQSQTEPKLCNTIVTFGPPKAGAGSGGRKI
jgi:hypothetical protein